MQKTFKSNRLQFIGLSEAHPDGYRRSFSHVIQDPQGPAIEDLAGALSDLTDEQISDGILTTATDLTLA